MDDSGNYTENTGDAGRLNESAALENPDAKTQKQSRMFELKQRLMRRAWDGDSNLAANGADMLKLIQMRLAQCRPSEDHADILQESRLMDMDQPRSVRMLNAISRANGSKTRYSESEGKTLH